MEHIVQSKPPSFKVTGYREAWQMVLNQLQMEMSRTLFDTWVQPLHPLGFKEGVFTLGAFNPYARDWVDNRLRSRITRLLEGVFGEAIDLRVVVSNGFSSQPAAESEQDETEQESESETAISDTLPEDIEPGKKTKKVAAKPAQPSPRKVMLQRAYGSKRAAVIQPERGMFVTLYFLQQWQPIIGHSAVAIILASRSMCYWNPLTGELRNEVETEMAELAKRAAVSVRTVKDVLNQELVKQYFLRYRVRRVMTPNGIRTAGIILQVRMDDPLTPQDQQEHGLQEEEHWYSVEFDGEED